MIRDRLRELYFIQSAKFFLPLGKYTLFSKRATFHQRENLKSDRMQLKENPGEVQTFHHNICMYNINTISKHFTYKT